MKTVSVKTVEFTIAIVLTAFFASTLPRIAGIDGMPQRGTDDILSMVFGDACDAFSQKFEAKADEYFHGGIHTDCNENISDEVAELSAEQDEKGEHIHTAECEHEHVHTDECEHSDEHANTGIVKSGVYIDPWKWINSRIHLQEHKHLTAQSYAELLPWFWAACKMSPDNSEAYENAAFVLALSMKMPEKGIEVLKEGFANNPGNASIACFIGEIYFRQLDDYTNSREWLLKAREISKTILSKETEEESIDRKHILLRALSFLGAIAERTGNIDDIKKYYIEAHATIPQHPTTKHLERLAAGKTDNRNDIPANK